MARIRGIVADLKSSFATGGIEATAQTHRTAVRTSWSYRLLSGLVNLVLPVNALLDILEDSDRQVGQLGASAGTRKVLERLPRPWQIELPAQGSDVLKTRPFVVFGKHGSVLTPFLIAASLDRPDLKMVSASYVAALGPNIARLTYPVYLPTPTFRRSGRDGILPRLTGWLTARLEPPVDKEAAKQHNREMLLRAAEHVRGGGGLLLAPDGRDAKARWRSGIGLLVAQLADSDSWLIPYRIWASNTAVFRLLSRNPLLRALGTRQYRQPIRVAFAEPFSVASVVEEVGSDPIAITEYLETYYRSLGF